MIKVLKDRTFSYAHLAQLKYLLQDVIEIMKRELQITLNVDAIAGLDLRTYVRARLLTHFMENPGVDEVPMATLPEPFNPSNQVQNLRPNLSSMGSSVSAPAPGQQIASASHFPQSFQTHFSSPPTPMAPERSPTGRFSGS